MTALVFKIEGNETPLDVISYKFHTKVIPIWSDGTFDGTHIEKIVGYEPLPSEGEIILANGDKILFSRFLEYDGGVVVITDHVKVMKQ